MKRPLLFIVLLVVVLGIVLSKNMLPIRLEQQIKNNRALIQKFMKDGCARYFDGCNTCFVDGSQWSCTIKACSVSSKPKCLEYQK